MSLFVFPASFCDNKFEQAFIVRERMYLEITLEDQNPLPVLQRILKLNASIYSSLQNKCFFNLLARQFFILSFHIYWTKFLFW